MTTTQITTGLWRVPCGGGLQQCVGGQQVDHPKRLVDVSHRIAVESLPVT